MGELKDIAYDCQKATLLIEKKQLAALTLREKLELKIHLAGCSVCRIFEKQSLLINQVIKYLFHQEGHPEIRLDDNYKKQLQQTITARLKK